MIRRALLTLALIAWGTASLAATHDVLVVGERTDDYSTGGQDVVLEQHAPLLAVERVLRGWGADYVVLPPSALTTEFLRTGIMYRDRIGTYGFDTASPADTFRSIIQVNFNGSTASQISGFRPDSLTLTAKIATVPLLLLVDPHSADVNMNQSTSCSTGTSAGNIDGHHAEATLRNPTLPDLLIGNTEGPYHYKKKTTTITGGLRPLLVANFNLSTLSQFSPEGSEQLYWPDSCQTTGANVNDTLLVWEKLNAHKAGAARIVFAACYGAARTDSSGTFEYATPAVDWHVLSFAIAHLDSLTGGRIIRKPHDFAFVVAGGGTRSDRRHPGGFFAADSNIVKASNDTTAAHRIKFTLLADPESLAVNAGDIALWKRANVRFAPWVRVGLDTLALGANGRATSTRAVDVWGRYRNRAIYGDGSGVGADTSVWALYRTARGALRDLVGEQYMSRLLAAPESDWTPYQVRRNQNFALVDSLAWLAATLGGPILVNTWGRDMDPLYLTNPKGWIMPQGRYTVHAQSRRGETVRFLGHQQFSVRGSRVGIRGDWFSSLTPTADTTSAFMGSMTSYGYQEYAFWNGFYGPWLGREYNQGQADLPAEAAAGWDHTIFDNWSIPGYVHNRASIFMVPAQSFGGQNIDAPHRWGVLAMRHINSAANLVNWKAGRTVLRQVWAEELNP